MILLKNSVWDILRKLGMLLLKKLWAKDTSWSFWKSTGLNSERRQTFDRFKKSGNVPIQKHVRKGSWFWRRILSNDKS
jgi:hypothetical protein